MNFDINLSQQLLMHCFSGTDKVGFAQLPTMGKAVLSAHTRNGSNSETGL